MSAAIYDSENIFAKILRGEIPAHKIYEDSDVVAIMDVMPQGPGHALVIPKSPSRNLFDADPQTLGGLAQAVRRVAIAARKAFASDGVTVTQFNESAAGQSVFHLHVHVIPRFSGVPLKPHSDTMEDDAVLAANAEKLRAAIASD
ncbi:MAG: HIT family protein [Hyphomicrobiales bacterium]|nr:HIT family protein [Hyphomicrobiales bacterium]